MSEVRLLGHIISQRSVVVDPSKVKVVISWEMPKNTSEVRSLLGLAGYYRWLIKGLSHLTFLITRLTRKEILLCWDSKYQCSFLMHVKKEINYRSCLDNSQP